MEKKRPIIITILCAYLALGAIANIFFTTSAVINGMEVWYLALTIISWLIGLATIIGLWRMKRWAVVLYTVFNIISIVILWTINTLKFEGAFFTATAMVIMISQFYEMN